MSTQANTIKVDEKALFEATAKYQQPNLPRAIWQIVNTFVPYIALWILMVYTIHAGTSYWVTLALAVLASGFLVRIFILFHDCGHQSFFASRRANTVFGYICGILTFTPYDDWTHAHGVHHSTAADLDRRGTGDVWTMTVEEYQAAPRKQRISYRFYRNPLVILVLGPISSFILNQRLPSKGANRRDVLSVIITDLALLAIIVTLSATIGFWTYVMIQMPIMIIGGGAGIWLFYVQHQFEGVYWARHEEWDRIKSALEGSSFYKLPKVLQWFTGNIGYHHVHHIRPRIPNYNLQRAHEEVAVFQTVEPITLRKSAKSLRMNLWDEAQQKLVSFRSLRARSRVIAP